MTLTDWFALVGCLTGVTSLGWNIYTKIDRKPKLQLSGHVVVTTNDDKGTRSKEIKLYITNASNKIVIIGWVDFVMTTGGTIGVASGYKDQIPMVLRPPEVGEVTLDNAMIPHPIEKILVRDSLKNEYVFDKKLTTTLSEQLFVDNG